LALADSRLRGELTSLDCFGLRLRDDRSLRVAFNVESKRERPALLVTGATGRLGRALLPRLQGEYEIWSLQRRADGAQTFKADLSQPDFGLDSDQWDFLESQIDSVLHLAAQVDLTLPLDSLAPTNTAPPARLAKLGKPIHFASTLAIPLCTDEDGAVQGGYPESKSLAEQTLSDITGFTFRFGHLIGPPRGDELLTIAIRGLLELGCCPTSIDPRLCFDWTPLEWAAEETARLLSRGSSGRETLPVRKKLHFHLNDLARVLKQHFQVVEVTMEEFSRVAPASQLATRACQALGKCRGELLSPAFDLFLLGNSPALLASSSPAPSDQLESYVSTVVAAGRRPPREAPARNDNPTRPCV
jgi:nucleoside-diphosphate-sugar epimerase